MSARRLIQPWHTRPPPPFLIRTSPVATAANHSTPSVQCAPLGPPQVGLGARRLAVGGRLVFLLPLPAAAEAHEALPLDALADGSASCMRLETICRQALSSRMHRLCVTICKVAEPDAAQLHADEWLGARRGDGQSEAWQAPWEEWWQPTDVRADTEII